MDELYDFLAEIDKLDDAGQEKLEKLIESTSELKQLPLVARKIMQVIENPKSTAGHLEDVIKTDQALTVKILKIANSSFYGLLRKVNTLQRAILVIGFKAIKDIAVSTAILNMYRSSDPYSTKVWENAIGVGIGARVLSLEFDKAETEEAFVGGLLHNLGKTLILRTNTEMAVALYKKVDADISIDEVALEKEVFGFSHTHAGGQLVGNWNLSPTLEASIRYYQHLPEVLWTDVDDSVKLIVGIIALSHKICRYLGIGYDNDQPEMDILNSPENKFLGISEGRLIEIVEEIKLNYFDESQLFS